MIVLIFIILISWIIILHFKIIEIERNYLGDTSSFKQELKKKDKDIIKLNREVDYYKNQKNYEEYLKD